MQALHWDGQRLRLDPAYPMPQVEAQTALVRVRLAGICSTDLQIFKGYMGFQGVPGAEHALSLAPLVINEVTVVGSRCGRFPPALQALAQARIAVTPLIDAMYPLTAGEAAVMHAARPETLKILLQQRP